MSSRAPSTAGTRLFRAPSADRDRLGGPIWRLALPGVCRLVDDPDRLARILDERPDARVLRLRPLRGT